MAAAYETEILAEIAAVELLCPIGLRETYIKDNGAPNEAARKDLARFHNLPEPVISGAFDQGYNESIRDLLNGA